ncbi:MAG: energy-coupling factor ABC transporter ATP-binding protein [Erysipelotrichaceae bacterium]
MKNIKLENVTFAYDNGFVAVEEVSMEIHGGEKVAIIGQNGAGKTTTVKLMNGLLRPTKGKVIVDDQDIASLTTATVSRKVGYVFQNPGDQIFNKDVYTEIAYTPKYMKLSEAEVERRVQDAARLCNIEKYLSMNPYDLPFSVRKFVTIASVIAMGADFIILDEPTAGQDADGMKQLKLIMNELIARGKTIITITHDMDFVIDNFERVIVMANKKVVGDTDVKAVFWDFEILEKSALKQPYVSRLAHALNLKNQVITIDDFIQEVVK